MPNNLPNNDQKMNEIENNYDQDMKIENDLDVIMNDNEVPEIKDDDLANVPQVNVAQSVPQMNVVQPVPQMNGVQPVPQVNGAQYPQQVNVVQPDAQFNLALAQYAQPYANRVIAQYVQLVNAAAQERAFMANLALEALNYASSKIILSASNPGDTIELFRQRGNTSRSIDIDGPNPQNKLVFKLSHSFNKSVKTSCATGIGHTAEFCNLILHYVMSKYGNKIAIGIYNVYEGASPQSFYPNNRVVLLNDRSPKTEDVIIIDPSLNRCYYIIDYKGILLGEQIDETAFVPLHTTGNTAGWQPLKAPIFNIVLDVQTVLQTNDTNTILACLYQIKNAYYEGRIKLEFLQSQFSKLAIKADQMRDHLADNESNATNVLAMQITSILDQEFTAANNCVETINKYKEKLYQPQLQNNFIDAPIKKVEDIKKNGANLNSSELDCSEEVYAGLNYLFRIIIPCFWELNKYIDESQITLPSDDVSLLQAMGLHVLTYNASMQMGRNLYSDYMQRNSFFSKLSPMVEFENQKVDNNALPLST